MSTTLTDSPARDIDDPEEVGLLAALLCGLPAAYEGAEAAGITAMDFNLLNYGRVAAALLEGGAPEEEQAMGRVSPWVIDRVDRAGMYGDNPFQWERCHLERFTRLLQTSDPETLRGYSHAIKERAEARRCAYQNKMTQAREVVKDFYLKKFGIDRDPFADEEGAAE